MGARRVRGPGPLPWRDRRARCGIRELCVVVISGVVHVASEHGEWFDIGGRADPWAGLPDAAYLPPESHVGLPRRRGRRRGRAVLGAGSEGRRAARPPRRRDRGRDPRTRRPRALHPPDPDGERRGGVAARGRGADPGRPLVELPAAQARPRRSSAPVAAGGDLLPPHQARARLRVDARVRLRDRARRGDDVPRPRLRARAARLPHRLGPARLRARTT